MGDRHKFLHLDSVYRFKKTVYYYDKEAPVNPGVPPVVSPTPTSTVTATPTITPTNTPTNTPTPSITPTPSLQTYYLLTEGGDTLITEGGDNLVWFPV